ncbi:hypothetical protein V6N12_041167 [Hibiscus sabdariffa]|uniref:Uncharacterized protein n=1 Tax=Hibiscus sabdariffa TaxID=183260 RepID=A0ABR2E6F2_9ROSI
MEKYKIPKLVLETKGECPQQADMEALELNEDQSINEKIKKHSLVEIKGRKKYGRNLNEQIQDESVYNKGDASKVNKQVKEDDPKAQLPNGIFPAIISGSLEDQAGTREKRDAFNASDSKFHAGKENVDDPSPPINAQIEELTSQTDKEIKDKIEINDDYDSPPSDDAKSATLGSLICNTFEKCSVTNKRKREELEGDDELEIFSCFKRKALQVAINKDIFQIGPGNWSDSGVGKPGGWSFAGQNFPGSL